MAHCVSQSPSSYKISNEDLLSSPTDSLVLSPETTEFVESLPFSSQLECTWGHPDDRKYYIRRHKRQRNMQTRQASSRRRLPLQERACETNEATTKNKRRAVRAHPPPNKKKKKTDDDKKNKKNAAAPPSALATLATAAAAAMGKDENTKPNNKEVAPTVAAPPKATPPPIRNPYAKTKKKTPAASTAADCNSFPRRSLLADGRVLSDAELKVFSTAICFNQAVIDIVTDSSGNAELISPPPTRAPQTVEEASSAIRYVCAFKDKKGALNYTGCRKDTDDQKIKEYLRFIIAIRDSKEHGTLADLVDDAQNPGQKTLRFVNLLTGERQAQKFNLLNILFLIHFETYRMKDGKVYQPSTTHKGIKQIFTQLKRSNINYDLSDFKQRAGTFANQYMKLFDEVAATDSTFARKPMQATTQLDDEERIRKNGKYNVNEYDDNMLLAMYRSGQGFVLRGGDELVNLKVSDLKHYKIRDGPSKGLYCYQKLGNNNDKTHKLELTSGKTSFRSEDDMMCIIVEDRTDPIHSAYATLHRHLKHFPPDYQGHIFVKRAPNKVLRQRRKVGNMFIPYYDQVVDISAPKGSGIMKAAGKLGKNRPSEMIKELADRCGFDVPKRATTRLLRRTAISKLNDRAPDEIDSIRRMARQQSATTTSLYIDPHKSKLANMAITLQYKGPRNFEDEGNLLEAATDEGSNDMPGKPVPSPAPTTTTPPTPPTAQADVQIPPASTGPTAPPAQQTVPFQQQQQYPPYAPYPPMYPQAPHQQATQNLPPLPPPQGTYPQYPPAPYSHGMPPPPAPPQQYYPYNGWPHSGYPYHHPPYQPPPYQPPPYQPYYPYGAPPAMPQPPPPNTTMAAQPSAPQQPH
eukprot:scaffold9944_cov93-Cylindrotheca_fusiformis.AAC.1